jgi:hypothetical protein
MIFTYKPIYKFVWSFHFDPTFLGSFDHVYYAHDCHLVDNSSFFISFVHKNNDSRFFEKEKNLPFQEQAKKWVKNMEASRGLEIVDLQVSTFDHFPWCT